MVMHGKRTKDDWNKRFRLDIKKNISTVTAVRQWNGFTQGGCAVPILGDFPGTTGQSPDNHRSSEGWGWIGPRDLSWYNFPAQSVSLRAGCPGPCLQRWRFHTTTGQLILVLIPTEKSSDVPPISLTPLASYPFTGHCWKEPVSIFSALSPKVLELGEDDSSILISFFRSLFSPGPYPVFNLVYPMISDDFSFPK